MSLLWFCIHIIESDNLRFHHTHLSDDVIYGASCRLCSSSRSFRFFSCHVSSLHIEGRDDAFLDSGLQGLETQHAGERWNTYLFDSDYNFLYFNNSLGSHCTGRHNFKCALFVIS